LHQGGATICDVFFFWAGVPGAQIHQHICGQDGDIALSHRVMYEWIKLFKNGLTSVTDAECLGFPPIATSAQNEERARELILQNRRVTVDEFEKAIEYQHWVCLFLW
jgi:hypothetical protein